MTWEETNRKRLTYERKFYPKLRRALKSMLMSVIQHLELGQKLSPEMFIVIVETDELKKALEELYLTTGLGFAKTQWKELQSIKQDETYLWEQVMQEYALLQAGMKVKTIVGTQKDTFLGLIDVIMNEAVENGYGVEKTASYLKRELLSRGIEYQKWQARRIVQTEVLGASNKAQSATIEEMNKIIPLKRQWLSGGISKTERHSMLSVNGMIVEVGQPFIFVNQNGETRSMMFPGDSSGGGAEDVINCKCIVQPVISE